MQGLELSLPALSKNLADYNPRAPIPGSSRFAQGLQARFLAVPPYMSGPSWYDLTGHYQGTLTSMGNASNGWQGTVRPGGFAQLLLDGTAGYVTAGNVLNIGGGNWTQTLWFRTSTNGYAPTTAGLVTKTSTAGGNGRYGVWLSAGKLSGLFQNSAGTTYNTPAAGVSGFNDANWHQVVFTINRSGAVATMYVDGKSQGTTAITNDFGTSVSTTFMLGFGVYPSGTGLGTAANFFAGWLDSISFYNYALAAADVYNLYQAERLALSGYLNVSSAIFVGAPY